jgi:sugar phosphate permease
MKSVPILRNVLIVSLPFPFVALVASYWFIEPEISDRHEDFRSQLKEIRIAYRADPMLLALLCYSALVFAFNQSGLWIYQPYFEFTGVELVFFGVIFATFQFVAALAGKLAWWFELRLGSKTILASLILISGLATLAMGVYAVLFSFAFIYLHQVVRGFYKVIISNQVNQRVSSNLRASVLSIFQLSGSLLYAMIIPFIGWYADVYDVQQAFVISGTTALLCGIPALYYLRRSGLI